MLLPRSWQALLQQGHILVGGRNFQLDHLLGHTVQFTILPAVTYPALLVDMHIEYSSHCVSVCATKEGARAEFDVFGNDRHMFDHRGAARAFCPDRHKWSENLPALIASLPERSCYFGSENWFVIEMIDLCGARGEYEVFFQLKKGDVAKTLRLVIESAYVRDPAGTGRGIPRNRRGTIRFSVMAAKRLRGERIRHPGHNR